MQHSYHSLKKQLAEMSIERRLYLLSALPTHLLQVGDLVRATQLLENYEFLTAKATLIAASAKPSGEVQYKGVYEILRDYEQLQEALKYVNQPHLQRSASDFELAIRDTAHILLRWPELAFQEIYPRVKSIHDGAATTRLGERLKRHQSSELAGLLRRPLQLLKRARVALLESDTTKTRSILTSSVRLSSELEEELTQPYALNVSWLQRLNILEPSKKFVQCLGHVGKINAMEFFTDHRLISFGNDGTVRIWNTAKGIEIGDIRFCGHALIDGKIAPDQKWGIALCAQCGVFRFDIESREYRHIDLFANSLYERGNTPFIKCHLVRHKSFNMVVAQGDTLWLVDLATNRQPIPLRAQLQDFSEQWTGEHLPVEFADEMLSASFGKIITTALDSSSNLLLVTYSVGGAVLWNLANATVEKYIPLTWQARTATFYHGRLGTQMILVLGCVNPVTRTGIIVDVYIWPEGTYMVVEHKGLAYPWELSPNGQFLAFTEMLESMIIVRQLVDDRPSTGTVFLQLNSHQGRVTSVNFAKDSSLIASGGEDGLIQIWQLTGTQSSANYSAQEYALGCFSLSEPSRIAILVQREIGGNSELAVQCYTLPTLTYLNTMWIPEHEAFDRVKTAYNRSSAVRPVLLLSRDGKTAACVIPNERGFMWEMAFNAWRWLMRQSEFPTKALTPSMLIWNTKTRGVLEENILVGISPGDWVISAALSRNGRFLVTLSQRGLVMFKDMRAKGETMYAGSVGLLTHIGVDCAPETVAVIALSGAALQRLDLANLEFETIWTNTNNAALSSYCFTHGSELLLLGDQRGQITELRLITNSGPAVMSVWQAHEGTVKACIVDETDSICVSAGDDLLVRLWQLDTLQEIAKAPVESPVTSLAIVAQAGIIVASDQNGRFYVWQLHGFLPNIGKVSEHG